MKVMVSYRLYGQMEIELNENENYKKQIGDKLNNFEILDIELIKNIGKNEVGAIDLNDIEIINIEEVK